MQQEIRQKVDAVIDRVKDPESGLSVADLGVVTKVRYSEEQQHLYIFTDFNSHRPGCVTCAGIALALMATIIKDLETEFQKEFPELTIEFI